MENSNIHIIAEAGSNNNGQLSKSLKLIDIANRSGADSVKFQIINTWGLYLPGEYEYGHYDIKDVIKFRLDGELSDDDYQTIANYCSDKIPFSSSVFDKKGLELLLKFNPPYIKLASCDLNNLRFLRQVAEAQKKIVLSTGMSSLQDIEKALNEIQKSNNTDLVIMHCVSVYPAYLKQTNLRFIEVLKKEFGFPVGFSDHTGTDEAACMAVALGATWFEKHFTEDKNQQGLDHKHAMEESGLKKYIESIRNAEIALNLRSDKLSEDELFTRKRARRSLYAASDLSVGHIIKDEDVLCLRPEGILAADQIDIVVGSKVLQPVKQYAAFTPHNIDIKE